MAWAFRISLRLRPYFTAYPFSRPITDTIVRIKIFQMIMCLFLKVLIWNPAWEKLNRKKKYYIICGNNFHLTFALSYYTKRHLSDSIEILAGSSSIWDRGYYYYCYLLLLLTTNSTYYYYLLLLPTTTTSTYCM